METTPPVSCFEDNCLEVLCRSYGPQVCSLCSKIDQSLYHSTLSGSTILIKYDRVDRFRILQVYFGTFEKNIRGHFSLLNSDVWMGFRVFALYHLSLPIARICLKKFGHLDPSARFSQCPTFCIVYV